MRTNINIDLHHDDTVWAWECFYKGDNRFIRKIVFVEGECMASSNPTVDIHIKDEKEFNEYIKFFNIPAERIKIAISV